MRWTRFCELYKIGERYKNPNLDSCFYLSNENNEILNLWVNNPSSLLISGTYGTGKTYIMMCLIRELLKKFDLYQMRLIKSKVLDDKLLEDAREYGSSSYFIETLSDTPFLFIDDFGVEKPTERMERDYYEIIDNRNSNFRPTIITTNLNNQEILNKMGGRIHSRFKEYLQIDFQNNDLRGTI